MNFKGKIFCLLVLIVVVSVGGLGHASSWPVVYPNKLMEKAPVDFPLSSNRSGLPGGFVQFVKFVKSNCQSKFGIQYNDKRTGKFLPGDVIAENIKKLNEFYPVKTACLMPVLAAVINFRIKNLDKISAVMTRFFSLSLMKTAWPSVLTESKKWERLDLKFAEQDARLYWPWLPEKKEK